MIYNNIFSSEKSPGVFKSLNHLTPLIFEILRKISNKIFRTLKYRKQNNKTEK